MDGQRTPSLAETLTEARENMEWMMPSEESHRCGWHCPRNYSPWNDLDVQGAGKGLRKANATPNSLVNSYLGLRT